MNFLCPGRLRRRPLIGLALCYVVGTVAGLQTDLTASVALGAAAGCLALAALARAAAWPLSGLVHLTVLFAGWAAASEELRASDGGLRAWTAGKIGQRIDVVGVVAEDPGLRPDAGPDWQRRRFDVRAESVRTEREAWSGAGGAITVLWEGDRWSRSPAYGERWRLAGTVDERGSGPMRLARLNVKQEDASFLSDGHGGWLMSRCVLARRAAGAYLGLGIRDYPVVAGILRALLLGYRGQISGRVTEIFQLTGTLHVFAISGLHVAIIGTFIVFVLRACRISMVHWFFFLSPLLALYTAATGAEASSVRACVMALAYFAAPLFGRRPDTASALGLSAIAILVCSPAQLVDRGFVLSYVCVIGLLVFYPLFTRPLNWFWRPDPFCLLPEVGWRSRLRAVGRGAWSVMAVSAAAWLSSAPLTAVFFGWFIPITLPANLIIVPVSSLVLLAACLSVVLGSCVAFVADVFNHANLALVSLLVWVADRLASLPGSQVRVDRPSLAALFGVYAAVGAAGLVGWIALAWSEESKGVCTSAPVADSVQRL